jgi:Cu(I)/Ag(I) efflux system membrane protein CusA/SilA
MIDWVIDQSIRHRWIVVGLLVALALGGAYAARHTPVDAIPDLSENQVIVFAAWPEHAPAEIEQEITARLSQSLKGIAGVSTVRGSSEFHFAMLNVIFDDSVTVAEARARVAERIQRVTGLPPDVEAVLAPEAPATGQIFWYVLVAPQLDLAAQRMLHDRFVKPELEKVEGVAEVASVGGFRTDYRIELDSHAVAEHGLELPEIASALQGTAHQLNVNDSSDKNVRALQQTLVAPMVHVADVARVVAAPLPRQGVFEMDGVETVGGVVMMRYGAHPLEVTERLNERLEEIERQLPPGVTLLTVYDRVGLIHSALATVSSTMLEAMVTASLCVVVVLLHFRTSLVIALTLPLTVLGSFFALWCLRLCVGFDARTNIMSLAGLVISIGVLVDSAVVVAENVVHALRDQFGDAPVRGDVRTIVSQACRGVGRPVFFSVLIMLISFLPVLSLAGLEGKMFRPLALTKSFALLTAAILAIVAVPALCTFLVRGRLRKEEDSRLVRATLEVYRPLLSALLDRPGMLALVMGVTFVVGFAPLGNRLLATGAMAAALLATAVLARSRSGAALAWCALIVVGLAVSSIMPLAWERTPPLDEGTAMDMPITAPGIPIHQAIDDLKMRDMVLCRFPEVDMVMGKAGRAETATDPAPLDMIETMIMLRPHAWWPRRKIAAEDAEGQIMLVVESLVGEQLIDPAAAEQLPLTDLTESIVARFDTQMREYCYYRNREHQQETAQALRAEFADRVIAGLAATGQLRRAALPADRAALAGALHFHNGSWHIPTPRDIRRDLRRAVAAAERIGLTDSAAAVLDAAPSWREAALNGLRGVVGEPLETLETKLVHELRDSYDQRWRRHTLQLNEALPERAGGVFARLAMEEILLKVEVQSPEIRAHLDDLIVARAEAAVGASSQGHQHGTVSPRVRRSPTLDRLQTNLGRHFQSAVLLQPNDRPQLGAFGGEMDQALQMPGWTNVWTRPIQNRVDMLSTGVNTDVGICMQGGNFSDVLAASQHVAEMVKSVPGASQVVVDPVRTRNYLHTEVDRVATARHGLDPSEVEQTLNLALHGKPLTTDDPQLHVRLVLGNPQATLEAKQALPAVVASRATTVKLGEVVRFQQLPGPTSIKSENGKLRNYVRLNIQGRDPRAFVAEAQAAIDDRCRLPEGVSLVWTGQFQYQLLSQERLALVSPVVLALIFGLLVWTFHDFADALLVLLAIPGAIAGGLAMQWVCGTPLSVTVLIGYIACFGMAASTGVVMLVYLREALAKAGGLEKLTREELRSVVLAGAVQRLRPKLLTELTTVIGLAPMLWATGVGSEVIRPMAAPVLGGILVADEVIDLFLPVAFFWVRSWRWQRLHRDLLAPKKIVETVTSVPR